MEHKDFSEVQWHGIQRKEFDWHPQIIEESCIGCGLCFVGCGRDVYDFDYEKKKPIVSRPYNCMVGCNTCGMNCLWDAVEFPSLGQLRKIIRKRKVIARAKKTRREKRGKARYHLTLEYYPKNYIKKIYAGHLVYCLMWHKPELYSF